MRAEHVVVRRPDGAVFVSTRKAFEVAHRPHGFTLIETPGVDPNRIVMFLASDRAGGGRVRSEWPSGALKQRGWHAECTTGWPLTGMEPGDVLIIHRPLASDIEEWVSVYQSIGVTVLVDEDDELERVPALNLGQPKPEQLRNHRRAIETADGLIVTTARLEEVYGPWARAVWRIPNHLPQWVTTIRSDLPRGPGVRVGWAGTLAVHRQDMLWFAPAASAALRGAVFTTVGDDRVPALLGLDPRRCIVEGLEKDIATFYRKMARADIGIVPLDNGPDRMFNTAKSDLKTKEWLALGKPVVATNLPEHRATLDGTGAGFLVDTPEEMAEAVQRLIRDQPLRRQMTQAARRAGRALLLERRISAWERPLKEVARGSVRERV